MNANYLIDCIGRFCCFPEINANLLALYKVEARDSPENSGWVCSKCCFAGVLRVEPHDKIYRESVM